MDIFELYKKLKPKGAMKYLVVGPGQITAPQLGIQQVCRTGIADGYFVVRLNEPLPPGTTCQGMSDDEESIRFELPNGMTRLCHAEESGGASNPPHPSGIVAEIPHKKTLEWVSCAASKDDMRRNLNGLRFDGNSLVATDGHRLHEARLVNAPDVPAFTFPISHVPLLVLASGGAGTWQISEDGEKSWICFGDKLFVHVPHMDNNYPDYKQIIPDLEKSKTREIYSAKGLFEVHKEAAKIVGKSLTAARWEIREGALDVSISTREIEWSQDLPAKIQGTVPVSGFNPKYIAELAKGSTGDLLVARQDDLAPALFGLPALPGCEKRRAVIMPMRL